MLFNSLEFVPFFLCTVGVYFALPFRFRSIWLLSASCYFYMAFVPVYLLILFALILLDFFAAIVMEAKDGLPRRLVLAASLAGNLGILLLFKCLSWKGSVLLPLGLSFHTFQSMAYTIEVYHRRQKVERNLGKYALYVLFFPQLVAGPIERPQNLLPQLDREHPFDYARLVDGLHRMLFGFVKKCVLADRLALLVNPVYDHPQRFGGPALCLATVFFAFQIYCDFSGYTDIALGVAKILGIDLMENFNRPYAARSLSEFWRRWHISLSTWFRDYLYLPLGGSRCSRPRLVGNLMVVFLLSGLWHGSRWGYLVWGALHGVFLVASRLTSGWRAKVVSQSGLRHVPRLHAAIQVATTFSLVTFTWIFFRASTLAQAGYIASHLFSGWSWNALPAAGFGLSETVCLGLSIGILEMIQILQTRAGFPEKVNSTWVRWAYYYALIFSFTQFAVVTEQPFLYFQF